MTPTPDQIRTAGLVLAKIATADTWAAKPDPAMAITWAECFAVHDLAAPDLLDAVVHLYADDTRNRGDRILPADVIRHARRIRTNRSSTEKATGDIDRHALTERRRAITDCPLCDPNGWIETDTGLVRCTHNRQLGG